MKSHKISELLRSLQEILNKVHSDQRNLRGTITITHENHHASATNLLNYQSLRSFDLRNIQRKLGYLGMSRLARAEAHTEASLKTTIFFLKNLLDEKTERPVRFNISIKKSEKLLKKNTARLLGKGHKTRRLRIMVTLPSKAADDYDLVDHMITCGMDVARINCAHDTPEIWGRMIDHVKAARKKHHRQVTIAMDIGGPKIRTEGLSEPLLIHEGEYLLLTSKTDPSENHAHIVKCSFKELFAHLKVNEPIFFDDGQISTRVIRASSDEALLEVIRTTDGKAKLKPDKGINFPESDLKLHGLTDRDREHLPFIAQNADIVNFSFVNTPEDVAELHHALHDLKAFDRLGIIYKIETPKAYNNLTSILLEAMKGPKFGVMIARGDLAIEAGWEKMGAVQREILATCNACHTPVIWATQVLENLAKKGLPSRSEITDAVNATKAECIMLNKGPHILEAVKLLNQIIEGSEVYQDKNAPLLPKFKKFGPHNGLL